MPHRLADYQAADARTETDLGVWGEAATEAGARDARQLRAAWTENEAFAQRFQVAGARLRGGMGEVVPVIDTTNGRKYAVKSVHPRRATRESLHRLLGECSLWMSVSGHPNIVACHFLKWIDGQPRIFADWADQGSLHDAIATGKLYRSARDAQSVVLRIAAEIARGLHHAHTNRVVHRDVKPANILLHDNVAMVSDFGIANWLAKRDPRTGEAIDEFDATAKGGSNYFASPEQRRGKPSSSKTDLWSWAVTVLAACIGPSDRPLWRAWGERVEKDEQDSPPDAPELLRKHSRVGWKVDPPQPLRQLLQQCLAERPEDRPAGFDEVAERLEGMQPTSRPPQIPVNSELEKHPVQDDADWLNNLALSVAELGCSPDAERHWRRALLRQPDHLAARFNLALYRFRLGQINVNQLLHEIDTLPVVAKSAGGWTRELLQAITLIEADRSTEALGLLGHCEVRSHAAPLAELAERKLEWNDTALRPLSHRNGAMAVQLAPECRVVAAAWPGELLWFDSRTGRQRGSLQIATQTPSSVRVDATGALVAVGYADGDCEVYELATQSRLFRFNATHGKPLDLRFGEKNQFLLLYCRGGLLSRSLSDGSIEGTVDHPIFGIDPTGRFTLHAFGGRQDKTWKSRDDCLQLWDLCKDDVACVDLNVERSKDSRLLLAPTGQEYVCWRQGDTRLSVQRWSDVEPRLTLTVPGDDLRAVTLSEDGLVHVNSAGDFHSFNLQTGERVDRRVGGRQTLADVLVSTGEATVFAGRHSIVGLLDHSTRPDRFWSTYLESDTSAASNRNAEVVKQLRRADLQLQQGRWKPAATALREAKRISGAARRDDARRRWRQLYPHLPLGSPTDAWLVASLSGDSAHVAALAVSDNGEHLLATHERDDRVVVTLWSLTRAAAVRNWSLRDPLPPPSCGDSRLPSEPAFRSQGPRFTRPLDKPASNLAWSTAERAAFVAAGDLFRIESVDNRVGNFGFENDPERVRSVAVSSDGRTAVMLHADGSVRRMDLKSGVRQQIGASEVAVQIALISDDAAVTLGAHGDWATWDIHQGEKRQSGKFRGMTRQNTAMWTGDCVTAVVQGQLRMWRVGKPDPIGVAVSVSGDERAAPLDPHHAIVAGGGQVRICNLNSRGTIHSQQPGQANDAVTCLALDARRSLLAVGDRAGRIDVWHLEWSLRPTNSWGSTWIGQLLNSTRT